MVKLLTKKRPDICIAVAGYPEIHSDAASLESDLIFLKEKCLAGASFIITQTCFSASKIGNFIKLCRKRNIELPIVVGIFVPSNLRLLEVMCQLCKIRVDDDDFNIYKSFGEDMAGFQAFAIDRARTFLRDIFENYADLIAGIHFFTLNNFHILKQVIEGFSFEHIGIF